ncbi:MAG: hypothetical protein WCE44_07630 [Candidatus Velthaea sp.]|jgi:hypothetical protein
MSSRRPRTSLTLVGAALVLLISIAIGQRIGDRGLRAGTDRQPTVVRPLATPVPEPSAAPAQDWKRQQIVSVATDPAFPDPRVARPATPAPSPTPRPTPLPTVAPYTSPPLPVPIVSTAPADQPTDAAASPSP